MGIFRRPTMEDRMDNMTERRRPWWATSQIKEATVASRRQVRQSDHRDEGARPYRGSRTEARHRK